MCYVGTIGAIIGGIFVSAVESGSLPMLHNTLLRGIVWILIVILPWWGWFSWIGGCLILLGGLLYVLSFLCGVVMVGAPVSGTPTQPLLGPTQV